MPRTPALIWLEPGQNFPSVDQTWGPQDPVPGLLAAGGALDIDTLAAAYRQGIFPWFSEGQPILWWSPDPRMVLEPTRFKLHPSLRKTLRSQLRQGRLEIRMDTAFERVIRACALTPRHGQRGTWILPEMVDAYTAFHQAGFAHSVETWWDGELVGGLYCIGIGHMVFGESMFSHRTDASKIALAALAAACQAWGVPMIDCQQNTRHLASLGAHEVSRRAFLTTVQQAVEQAAIIWRFDPVYWNRWLATPR